MRLQIIATAVIAAWLAAPAAAQAGDLEDGKAYYFDACQNCHGPISGDVVAGGPSDLLRRVMMPVYGPPLKGVVGRPAGTEDFEYSASFLEETEDLVWTRDALDRFLENTREMVPGTSMFFREPDAEKRRQVIDYLEANS